MQTQHSLASIQNNRITHSPGPFTLLIDLDQEVLWRGMYSTGRWTTMQGILSRQVSDDRERSEKTGLWHLPVNPGAPPNEAHIMDVGGKNKTSSITHGAANSVYTLPYKHQQLKYTHQIFCNPLIATLGKQLQTINSLDYRVWKINWYGSTWHLCQPHQKEEQKGCAPALEAQEAENTLRKKSTVRLWKKKIVKRIVCKLR